MKQGYLCSACNSFHEKIPLSYGADKPEYWFNIAEEERETRCEYSSDQFIIDNEFFFIRGCLEIPIINSSETFQWGVWVSLSKVNFERASELWETNGRENEPAYFGWLSTRITIYPDTLNLKTNVHTRPVGQRPLIELEPTDHPLAIDQRNGITMDRVHEIAKLIGYCESQ